MSLQIRSIAVYSHSGELREVKLELGALNIVTGGSKTGKSALLDIVDYCWGRTDCSVAEGEIRRSVSWFAVLFDSDGEGLLVARKNPGPAKKTSDEIYFQRNVEGLPANPSSFEKNITSDGLRVVMSAVLGISENTFVPEPGSTRSAFEVSASQAIFFCLQAQDEIASRRLLFHRQGEQFIPQAIKDALPYFVGAIGEDYFLKQKRYDEARQRLRRLDKELSDARAMANQTANTGQSLLDLGKRVGLIPLSLYPASSEEQVRALEDAAAPREMNFRPNDDSSADLSQLENDRRRLRTELTDLREEIRDLTRLSTDVSDFEREASEQRARLSSIELLPAVEAHHDICPLCESNLAIPVPSVDELRQSLFGLERQLETARRDVPRVQRRIAELESSVVAKELELKKVQDDYNQRIAENERLRIEKDQFTEQARVAGRIGYYLENRQVVADNDGVRLAIARTKAEIEELAAVLDQEAVEERVTTALGLVGRDITIYATELDLEHGTNPLRLDRKNLTVVADTIDGPLLLSQIGSGENWVGYHVAAHLALHKLFRARNRPVPGFLMLDQPSQAHYPPERDVGEITGEDEDQVSVTRLFRLLKRYPQDDAQGMQIIVMDHVELLQDWFRESIVQKWRDGIKLVPVPWLRN